MKKFFAFILSALILIFPNYAKATENISFGMEFSGEELRTNRGFNIYFSAKSASPINISTLRLDISYDSSKLKFLSAESESDIDYSENESGIVRIVWLSSSGKAISSKPEQLFTIRFKPTVSPKNTSYDFSAKIYEAVSSNAEYLSFTDSPSINITSNYAVNTYNETNSKSEKSQSESSKTKNNSKPSSKSVSEAQIDSQEADETESNTDISIGERKSINSENGFTYFIYGAGGMLALIAIIFLSYTVGKKHSSKK